MFARGKRHYETCERLVGWYSRKLDASSITYSWPLKREGRKPSFVGIGKHLEASCYGSDLPRMASATNHCLQRSLTLVFLRFLFNSATFWVLGRHDRVLLLLLGQGGTRTLET